MASLKDGRRLRLRAGEAGFAMIEALIAFAVMAVGLGTLAGGIAVALRTDARGASTLEALRLAQALYAQAGTSIALETKADRDGRGFRWQIVARPVRAAPPGGAQPGRAGATPTPPAALPARGPDLVWVSIAVQAPGGGTATLAGLKPAPAGRPPSLPGGSGWRAACARDRPG